MLKRQVIGFVMMREVVDEFCAIQVADLFLPLQDLKIYLRGLIVYNK